MASATYHKNEPLTYSSNTELALGAIVAVPLRSKEVIGIVVAVVTKPGFAAKSIITAPDLPALPPELVELLNWMRSYYPAPLGIIAQLFMPNALPKKPAPLGQPSQPPVVATLPPLTKDQQDALRKITARGLHMLHGETGSGKTRVYLELALRSLARNKSSIILTPEIGLTSQLAETFRSVLGDRVAVVHSGLTEAKRQQTWQTLLVRKEPSIVIGARSALFSPLPNVGLIVVDEAHETAYKQDQAPYYHATSVAAKLAELHGATLVIGSATPLVRDYYVAKEKNRPIVRMTQIAAGSVSEDRRITIVDLKDRSKFTKSPYLSNDLLQAIHASLQGQEQSLLFLNRRGTARVVFCETCSWQAVCPHCDLPLVYHGDHHSMRCHSCSHKAPAPLSCPTCKGADIVFKSVGTKAIADEVHRLFPGAKVMRFDTDNKKSERLESHYSAVRAGGVDIIVGTQTLAKGLDLPKLGLVGVIMADTSLYFPDFSAQERTYQLLSQVLGRVGRGHMEGSAIIQTYSPDSALIKSVTTKDWSTFYNNELEERRQFLFPPFCYVLKLSCKRALSSNAQKAAENLIAKIRSHNYNVVIEGPAPSFHEKIQNKFVWQLIVKSKRREHLTSIINSLPSGWSYDIDPMNLL